MSPEYSVNYVSLSTVSARGKSVVAPRLAARLRRCKLLTPFVYNKSYYPVFRIYPGEVRLDHQDESKQRKRLLQDVKNAFSILFAKGNSPSLL
jgi:hypothetical protein